MKIFAIMSGKGGVGKSTITTLISLSLSEHKKTLVLDFDLAGPSIGRTLNVTGKVIKTENGLQPIQISENLYVLTMSSLIKSTDCVVWRGPKKISTLDLFFNSIVSFDYVVIDTPPGVSEEHYFLADKNVNAIIVSSPQNVALNDATVILDFCNANKIEIVGIIENLSGFECGKCKCRTNIFGSKGAEQMANFYKKEFLGRLNIDKKLMDAIDNGNVSEKRDELDAFKQVRKIVDDFLIK